MIDWQLANDCFHLFPHCLLFGTVLMWYFWFWIKMYKPNNLCGSFTNPEITFVMNNIFIIKHVYIVCMLHKIGVIYMWWLFQFVFIVFVWPQFFMWARVWSRFRRPWRRLNPLVVCSTGCDRSRFVTSDTSRPDISNQPTTSHDLNKKIKTALH